MSEFLRHAPCPACGPDQDGSGDNLAIYTDGHKWCFACGFYAPSTGLIDLVEFRKQLEKRRKENGVVCILPNDFTHIIPERPLAWMYSFGITNEEIQKNKIGWTETFSRLIFPIFDSYDNLLMWQGRLFLPGGNEKESNRSRFHSSGRPEKVDAYFGDIDQSPHSAIFVVEDVISAIKVARVCPSIPLFGSELSVARLLRISNRFENLIIWLDHDKASYQAKCEIKASPFFKSVRGIYTVLDPKLHSVEDIRKCL